MLSRCASVCVVPSPQSQDAFYSTVGHRIRNAATRQSKPRCDILVNVGIVAVTYTTVLHDSYILVRASAEGQARYIEKCIAWDVLGLCVIDPIERAETECFCEFVRLIQED